jgi:hypothetical protein
LLAGAALAGGIVRVRAALLVGVAVAGAGVLVHRAFIIAPIRCSALALAWM